MPCEPGIIKQALVQRDREHAPLQLHMRYGAILIHLRGIPLAHTKKWQIMALCILHEHPAGKSDAIDLMIGIGEKRNTRYEH